MVVGDVVNISSEVLYTAFLEVGKIALWLQTLGILIILWFTFQIIALIINRKRRKVIYSIKKDLVRIEKKIDKLSKKK